MAPKISDAEIRRLISEKKPLSRDRLSSPSMREKRGHLEASVNLEGDRGNQFRVILRQSMANHLSFSAILAYAPDATGDIFRLRRYNGKGPHTNRKEIDQGKPRSQHQFNDFHIHTATERYQGSGWREDHYAEISNKFHDLSSAIQCLIEDCNIILPSQSKGDFFGKEFSQ